MKTTTASNDSAPTTLATVLAVLSAADPDARWALEGWANHIRDARHANHAANSHAKHAREFGESYELCLALTLARLVDFGLAADAARELVDARMAAREARAAA